LAHGCGINIGPAANPTDAEPQSPKEDATTMTTVLKDFERWKQFLSERVEQAHKAGMSDETISKLAFQIGEYLSDKVDPENQQERVLKDLWDAADENERRTLARLMVKLVSDGKK
jgi:hypothetical protein